MDTQRALNHLVITASRFDGRQTYDNVTVQEADKKAIIEMFEVEEAVRSGNAI